ncbi:MAG: CBS domain-containing protein [Saprospiraceae bacterium]|nr:CBS domain-containing protein [Saprospiraceae bacterium]
MKKREPIEHIMSKKVKSVLITDSLETVAKIFEEEGIHHLPVMNGHEVVGIISSSDINRLKYGSFFDAQEGAEEALFQMLSIEKLMTKKPLKVDVNDSIREVAEIFANAHFHALPVMDEGKLVGMVSSGDIIKYFIEL